MRGEGSRAPGRDAVPLAADRRRRARGRVVVAAAADVERARPAHAGLVAGVRALVRPRPPSRPHCRSSSSSRSWLRERARGRREQPPRRPVARGVVGGAGPGGPAARLHRRWCSPPIRRRATRGPSAVRTWATCARDGGCGVADDVRVALPGSAQATSNTEATRDRIPARMGAGRAGRRAPPIRARALARAGVAVAVVRLPAARAPVSSSPGQPEPPTARAGVGSSPRWTRRRLSKPSRLTVDFALGRGPRRPLAPDHGGELPPPPRPPTASAFVLRSEVVPGPAVAVTAPVTYSSETLVRLARPSGFADPGHAQRAHLLPVRPAARARGRCRRDAAARRDGARRRVGARGSGHEPVQTGVLDLYPLERLPSVEAPADRGDVIAVYAVDRRQPEGSEVPPDRTTFSS